MSLTSEDPITSLAFELVTLDDIAAMCRCGRRHARDVVVKLVGFPRQAPVATRRNPLWLTSEVRAFLHRRPKPEE